MGTSEGIVVDAVHRVFAPEETEVRSVRHFVVELATRWGFDPDPVALVASELATNAVLHARSNFEVTLIARGDQLIIEVSDDNPRPPVATATVPGALSGRGLVLVAAVARAWGVRTTTDGKVVWAEL